MLSSHSGSFTFSPDTDLVAGQYVEFRLVYTAGSFGLDEIGGIRVALRLASDLTPFQFDYPEKPGYTKIITPKGNSATAIYDSHGGIRPWYKLLSIKFSAPLLPDDEVQILFGDTSEGGPGVRMQTFCEKAFQFKCYVDPFGTNNYIAIPCSEAIEVLPDKPVAMRVFLPSTTKPNTNFRLRATSVDKWGNPCAVPIGKVKINSNFAVKNLPQEIDVLEPALPLNLDGLTLDNQEDSLPPVPIRIEMEHKDTGILGTSNPCIVSDTHKPVFWADLHGQSEESIGTNSARSYFQFARDCACLDMVSHQANDFQISHAFWMHLNNLTEHIDSPGSFLAIPGYEWSGNTHLGGDHNVYFRNESEAIARAHKALITDKSSPYTDAFHINDLFRKFSEDDIDAVINAHVGGRHADLSRGHDPHYRASVELHSAWGTFEWLIHQAFELEQRVGIVCASDDHQGRPGASHPGTSLFGAMGGLTAYVMGRLDRDSLFDAMRNRHHYGTSGCRMFMDVTLYGHHEVTIIGNREREDHIYSSMSAVMGDIVETDEERLTFAFKVCGTAPILCVELFDGLDKLETFYPHVCSDTDKRIRILWHGANCKTRQRTTRWNGQLEVGGTTIKRVEPINFFNPEKQPQLYGDDTVSWESGTAGGFAGVDLFLESSTGNIAIETEQGKCQVALSREFREARYELGGIGKKITMQRIPEEMTVSEVQRMYEINANACKENKLFIKVTQEDGHVGWSSPIYLNRIEE